MNTYRISACKPCIINTYKTLDLKSFRMNTYKKRGRGVPRTSTTSLQDSVPSAVQSFLCFAGFFRLSGITFMLPGAKPAFRALRRASVAASSFFFFFRTSALLALRVYILATKRNYTDPMTRLSLAIRLLFLLFLAFFIHSTSAQQSPVNLPNGRVLAEVPGHPRPINNLPTAAVLSPDNKFAVFLHSGYGSYTSGEKQSLTVLNLETNELADFPDDRLSHRAHQTYFLGLAFSLDGHRLYASMASLSDPLGKNPGDTGNGIAVYTFADGRVTPEKFFPLAPRTVLPKGKLRREEFNDVTYPAGLSVANVNGAESILVACNNSDEAILLSATDGKILPPLLPAARIQLPSCSITTTPFSMSPSPTAIKSLPSTQKQQKPRNPFPQNSPVRPTAAATLNPLRFPRMKKFSFPPTRSPIPCPQSISAENPKLASSPPNGIPPSFSPRPSNSSSPPPKAAAPVQMAQRSRKIPTALPDILTLPPSSAARSRSFPFPNSTPISPPTPNKPLPPIPFAAIPIKSCSHPAKTKSTTLFTSSRKTARTTRFSATSATVTATPPSRCTARTSLPISTISPNNSASSTIFTTAATSPATATSGPTPPPFPITSQKPGPSATAAPNTLTIPKAPFSMASPPTTNFPTPANPPAAISGKTSPRTASLIAITANSSSPSGATPRPKTKRPPGDRQKSPASPAIAPLSKKANRWKKTSANRAAAPALIRGTSPSSPKISLPRSNFAATSMRFSPILKSLIPISSAPTNS